MNGWLDRWLDFQNFSGWVLTISAAFMAFMGVMAWRELGGWNLAVVLAWGTAAIWIVMPIVFAVFKRF